MATKKSGAKKTPAKKTPAKKAGAKKPASKASASEEPGTKKAPAKKASAKKAPAKKTPAKKASAENAERKQGKAGASATKKGKFAAADVHMGHIFSLRPRVTTSFRPEDLRSAKHHLAEEAYKSAAEAARAVADKALELIHDGPSRTKKGGRASKRW